MDSLVYQILKTKSIVDYLERKGHKPVRQLSGGRFSYLCPFVDHKETKPSFMVWTNAEFENFHCFGCQRGYSIVHLVAALEEVPYREAVEILGEGLEVSLEEDVRLQIDLLDKRLSHGGSTADMAQKLLTIGTRCRYYLESVDLAESEVTIVDKFYETLDSFILNLNFEAVDACFEILSSILRLRRDKFSRLHRKALEQQYQETE
jgi:DNA primase